MTGHHLLASAGALLFGCLAMAVSLPGCAASLLDEERGVLSFAPVLERIAPGVVNIAVRHNDPFFGHFFEPPELLREPEAISVAHGAHHQIRDLFAE